MGVPVEITDGYISSNILGATVRNVKRCMYGKGRQRKKSLSVMLEFAENHLPSEIQIPYSNELKTFPVERYIHPPLRCFNCQRLGHTKAKCKHKQRCSKCGEEDHGYDECLSNVFKCCNCGKDHSAAYGGCLAYRRFFRKLKYKNKEHKHNYLPQRHSKCGVVDQAATCPEGTPPQCHNFGEGYGTASKGPAHKQTVHDECKLFCVDAEKEIEENYELTVVSITDNSLPQGLSISHPTEGAADMGVSTSSELKKDWKPGQICPICNNFDPACIEFLCKFMGQCVNRRPTL